VGSEDSGSQLGLGSLVPNLLVFGRLLRSLGLDVTVGQIVDVIQAFGRMDIGHREDVYHTMRALLVRRREHLGLFDRAFDAFWSDHGERWGRRDLHAIGEPRGSVKVQIDVVTPEGPDAPPDADEAATEHVTLPEAPIRTASSIETLRNQDFAEFTPDELALARTALAELQWDPGSRRTRRWRAGRGPRIDLRRAFRHTVRTGEILRLPRRVRRTRPRPLVILCDVSGSMERYSRMLLQFAHTLTRTRERVEAFLFSTRLTRVTLQLRANRIDEATSAVARSVPDWSGGTRIGDALRTLNQRWARSVFRDQAVVLVVSDGWDRGDPVELRNQVARLQRSCHRLVWLSPLLGTADYAPLTRGLVAALPFVDDFLPARTLANLEDLARHLSTLAPRRRPRRQFVVGGP
jgi:uncharacterized protein